MNKMSSPVEFHAQLASIMEVLANAAVAEICELVDGGYALLHLEISRGNKENDALRRRLRLMELKVARVSALRAAGVGGSAFASSRARAAAASSHLHLHHHHLGHDLRRGHGGELPSPRVSAPVPQLCGDPPPPAADPGPGAAIHSKTVPVDPVKVQTPLIKVETEDEPWQQDKGFHDDLVLHSGPENPAAEAPPPLAKQEAVTEKDAGSGACSSWEGPGPAPPLTPPAKRSPSVAPPEEEEEPDDYDCIMYPDEPRLQHASFLPGGVRDPAPEEEEAGCSYSVGLSAPPPCSETTGLRFPFSLGEETGPEAPPPPPADELHAANGKEAAAAGGSASFAAQDDWPQDGFGAAFGGGVADEDAAGGKAFVCSFCGKTLACLKNLKTHMRVHTGEKPFGCALCSKRFSDSSNLKRHQSVHTGEKRYGCVHCGKRFAQSGSLKVHMSVHTGCKQFTCPYCGKTFISVNHLRRHVVLHRAPQQLPAPPR